MVVVVVVSRSRSSSSSSTTTTSTSTSTSTSIKTSHPWHRPETRTIFFSGFDSHSHSLG